MTESTDTPTQIDRIEKLLEKILETLQAGGPTNVYGESGSEALQNSIARGIRGMDTYGSR